MSNSPALPFTIKPTHEAPNSKHQTLIHLRSNMRPASPILAAALFALSIFALAGCETTRGNKLHAPFEHMSDITTTPHPNPKYASIATGIPPVRGNKMHSQFESVSDISTTPHPQAKFASVSAGIPPVPGSPTAAGDDGTQPLHDSQARKDPGAEKGIPMYPSVQPKDRFIRQ